MYLNGKVAILSGAKGSRKSQPELSYDTRVHIHPSLSRAHKLHHLSVTALAIINMDIKADQHLL